MQTRVGIIGAMEVEVERLKEAMDEMIVSRVAGMEFCEGTLSGVPVVVVRCGVGKVHAAMCAQALVDRFSVTHVVNTGIAGSLDKSVGIGDLVISTAAVHHDVDVTQLGYEPGRLPGLDAAAIPTDGFLRGAAHAAATEVAPGVSVFEGVVATGDQFVHTDDERRRISGRFGALCCEMEGAAIAQACHLNDVPCVVVRVISDRADGTSDVDYPTFERESARRCAGIVAAMVARLA